MEWVAGVEPVEVLRRKASMGAAGVALSLGGKRRGQGRKTRWFRHAVRKTESWSSWAVQFWVRPNTTLLLLEISGGIFLLLTWLLCWRISG